MNKKHIIPQHAISDSTWPYRNDELAGENTPLK